MHYVVYTKGDAQKGFAEGEGCWLLRTNRGESKGLTFLQMSTLLGSLLRSGYTKDPALVFYDKRRGEFTGIHPDLASGGADWVLAAEPSDLAKGVASVSQRMQTSAPPTVIHPVEIDAWARRQGENEKLIVAFRDHPAWALLLAEMAMQSGWVLRGHPALGVMPRQSPSIASEEWDAWLGQHFPSNEVSSTRIQLGLSIGRAFQASPRLLFTEGEGLLGI